MKWYQKPVVRTIGKWIRAIIIFLLTCGALAFLAFTIFGYRLAISENAVPDWAGISTVVSWVLPTVVSTIALFIAVRVPLQIAKSQKQSCSI